MSSHHYVKEGQEPALIILDAISFHRVEPLLEWVPLIMVAERALECVLQWGIKIDVVLQDEQPFDKLEAAVKDQHPVLILPVKDNVLTKGFQFLIQRKQTSVNLISNLTEEIFPIVENLETLLPVGIYSENEKWCFVPTGKFEKWLPSGSKLSIKRPEGTLLQTTGLHQSEEEWLTNRSGIVLITSKAPFWIGEFS